MFRQEYSDLMRRAAKRLRDMDASDRAADAATPSQVGPIELFRTARAALESAIHDQDWDTAAEALVMLSEGVARTQHMKPDAI